MNRKAKEMRAEALEVLHCFQLAFELTGDLRADIVDDAKAAVAATKRRVRAAKASPAEGKERKRRSK